LKNLLKTLNPKTLDLKHYFQPCLKNATFCFILQMTFDYQYIDPGPDDPGCTKNRYFALNVSIRWY